MKYTNDENKEKDILKEVKEDFIKSFNMVDPNGIYKPVLSVLIQYYLWIYY